MRPFRLACFNVQNLFSRPRLFAAGDDAGASAALRGAAQLQRLLDAKVYNPDEIIRTWNENRLSDYITVQSDRVNSDEARSQRFFFHERGDDDGSPVVSLNSAIHGRNDWLGGIVLKGETLSGPQVQAIAKVILKVDADVIGLCEVEDRRTLEAFNARHLGRKYPYCVLIEGNDERGIDVALMSKHPVGALRSNASTVDPQERARGDGVTARLFNRDCLEAEIELPDGHGILNIMLAHLKSKRGNREAETDSKRQRQSAEMARIVAARYTARGRPHRVAVMGDFNETPDRDGLGGATSIEPILKGAGLADVIRQTLGPDGSYTHVEEHGGGVRRGQIDYLLLSPDLRAAAVKAGIDRSGQAFWGPKAPPRALAASDHACLYVDLDLARLAAD